MATNWKLGSECSLKIKVANEDKELALARDVTVELGGTEVEVTNRGSGGVKQYVLGMRDLTISGTCLHVPDDPAVAALISAHNTKDALEITISDPTHSYIGKWAVTKLINGQPLDDVATLDFTLRPTIEKQSS